MKTSSKAFNCSGVCFSLCASPGSLPRVSNRVIAIATPTPSCPDRSRVMERSLSVGEAWREHLVAVVAGAGVVRLIGEDVLAPHHVLVLHLRVGGGEPSPAHAVVWIAWVSAHHRFREARHTLWRVRPRPRGRQHANRPHLADLVVEHLVRVTVDIRDVAIGLENLVHLTPVAHPEVPGRVVLIQWIVAENHDRLVLAPG